LLPSHKAVNRAKIVIAGKTASLAIICVVCYTVQEGREFYPGLANGILIMPVVDEAVMTPDPQ
jgi:hypothetical protein